MTHRKELDCELVKWKCGDDLRMSQTRTTSWNNEPGTEILFVEI